MGKTKAIRRPKHREFDTNQFDEAAARKGHRPEDLLAPPVYYKAMRLSRQIHLSTRKEHRKKKAAAALSVTAVEDPDTGLGGLDKGQATDFAPSIPADSRWHFINEMRNIPVWVATFTLQANRREAYSVERLALILRAEVLMDRMTAQVRVSKDCGWLTDRGYHAVSPLVGDVNAQLRGWSKETADKLSKDEVIIAETLAGIWHDKAIPLRSRKHQYENKDNVD